MHQKKRQSRILRRLQKLYGQLTYSGKRIQKPAIGKHILCRRRRWRPLVAMGAALCLLVVVCGRSYSYFSAKDKVVNQLDMSELDFVIEEPSWEDPDTPVRPGDVLPKDPQIVNTGETAFVVRVKIQEVWTPKTQTDPENTLPNPGYVRFFAADQGGELENGNFSAQQLLNIAAADREKTEEDKNFALRLNLTPNKTNVNETYWNPDGTNGWYRGSSENSEWLYYNQIVPVAGRTMPVFRAITIRTAEDVYTLDDITSDDALSGADYSQALEQAYADKLAEYNDLLTQYDLDIYVYAETVQADAFAWQDAWGDDLPAGWKDNWGVSA